MSKALGVDVQKAEFLCSAVKETQYPKQPLPEVAFAGRSNVGKSSLINALTARPGLAKTSKKPGRTRLINFFYVRLKRGELRFVDLPGYGYAKVSKKERQLWQNMIESYLANREELKLVVLIVDSKLEPQPTDIMLARFCAELQIPHIIAATKADKLPKTQLAAARSRLAKGFNLAPEDVFLVSSTTKYGLAQLWRSIVAVAF